MSPNQKRKSLSEASNPRKPKAPRHAQSTRKVRFGETENISEVLTTPSNQTSNQSGPAPPLAFDHEYGIPKIATKKIMVGKLAGRPSSLVAAAARHVVGPISFPALYPLASSIPAGTIPLIDADSVDRIWRIIEHGKPFELCEWSLLQELSHEEFAQEVHQLDQEAIAGGYPQMVGYKVQEKVANPFFT